MTETWDGEGELTIAVFDDPQNSAAACVAASLAADIAARFAARNECPVSIIARAAGAVAGGLNGSTHWGWFYIRHLWVAEKWRRRGLGRLLLAEAETQAKSRSCGGIYVDTFDADAALFYERSGFVSCGRVEEFPPGHTRIFLHKRLAG